MPEIGKVANLSCLSRLRVLEDLKREGLALMMVTHEIHVAHSAADRVFLLGEGRIAEEGTPEQVIESRRRSVPSSSSGKR